MNGAKKKRSRITTGDWEYSQPSDTWACLLSGGGLAISSLHFHAPLFVYIIFLLINDLLFFTDLIYIFSSFFLMWYYCFYIDFWNPMSRHCRNRAVFSLYKIKLEAPTNPTPNVYFFKFVYYCQYIYIVNHHIVNCNRY